MIEAKVITGEEIAIDCTIIKAWCNVYRRQKSGKQARWGFLRKDGGKVIWIYGYKVHIVVDAKTDLPIAFKVTPANQNEGKLVRLGTLYSPFPFFGKPIAFASSFSFLSFSTSLLMDGICCRNIRSMQQNNTFGV
ncbi:MAG: transposase [Halobacteria archaeon]